MNSSDMSLLSIEGLEFYLTTTLHGLDMVTVEMVGEEFVSFVAKNFSTIFAFNTGYNSFSGTFGTSLLPLPLENFVAFFIKVFLALLQIIVSYISICHAVTVTHIKVA